MPRKVGRPHKCTPEVIKRTLEACSMGASPEVSAGWVGIRPSTFYKYLARGRDEIDRRDEGKKPLKDEAPFVEFAEAVEKGRANSAMKRLALIDKAGNEGSWQAAAWLLERTRPKEYARRFVPELPTEEGEIKVELKWQNAKQAEE